MHSINFSDFKFYFGAKLAELQLTEEVESKIRKISNGVYVIPIIVLLIIANGYIHSRAVITALASIELKLQI